MEVSVTLVITNCARLSVCFRHKIFDTLVPTTDFSHTRRQRGYLYDEYVLFGVKLFDDAIADILDVRVDHKFKIMDGQLNATSYKDRQRLAHNIQY